MRQNARIVLRPMALVQELLSDYVGINAFGSRAPKATRVLERIMSPLSSLFQINLPLNRACEAVKEMLESKGWAYAQTFDLQVARASHPECPCPFHGTARCDCQMLIIVIYAPEHEPMTLTLHGHENRTWVSLAALDGQDLDSEMTRDLRRSLRVSLAPSGKPQATTGDGR